MVDLLQEEIQRLPANLGERGQLNNINPSLPRFTLRDVGLRASQAFRYLFLGEVGLPSSFA
jgi:hypothetical protein